MYSLFVLTVLGSATASLFHLDIHLKQSNLETFEKTFWDVSTPGSESYLQFLSTDQIASMIGASDADIASVHKWLKASGGLGISTSSLRDTVTATFEEAPSSLRFGRNGIPHKDTYPACVEFVVRRDPRQGYSSSRNFDRQSIEVLNAKKSASSSEYTISNIKDVYGIPTDLQATNEATQQMVWGPGTFGYSPAKLAEFKDEQAPLINMDKVVFDTDNHGEPGGDNFMEGQLDVDMISAFGLNVTTVVSNTNTSASTEETTGFGAALLDFLTELAARKTVPHVLSMSLGSLSAASCDYLCAEAVAMGHTQEECESYMETQRQVCMFLSTAQTARISVALQVLGVRGVTVLGSSGDGGSHFSFMPFTPTPGDNGMADDLNTISCAHQIPVFPTTSPYIVSVGGEMWDNGDPSKPITWASYPYGSGGGVSMQFDMPAHQKKTVEAYYARPDMPPANSFDPTKRAYPDISAVGVSGTSQSCPILGGIFATLIDMRLTAGLPPLGFIAPRIYELAEEHPGEVWEDIVGGNSGLACGDEGGFPASEGWDANTGFGRPIWTGMVKYFASDDHL